MELKETRNGEFVGTWTDQRTGTSAIKGVRTSTKMAFSLTYQHPKVGRSVCDVAGEIEDGRKILKIKYTESWKVNGKKKIQNGEAVLKRE